MKIEVLLTEAEIAQEFNEAVEARDLPEKFFYWSPGSVEAWRTLSQSPAYAGLLATARTLFQSLLHVGLSYKDGVSVLSFGAGDGTSDCLLLKSLISSGSPVQYFPVDASQNLLEEACCAAENLDIETLGVKADISSPVHVVLAGDVTSSRRIVVLTGNTLGGFDPLDVVHNIGKMLNTGDVLIVDGELHRESMVRDHSEVVCRDFSFAPLAAAGLIREDGQIRIEQKRDERHEGLHLLASYFHGEADLRLVVNGGEFLLSRGERVLLNVNYSFTREAFRWLLTKQGGLQILSELPSPDGRFLTAVCSR